MHVDGRGSRIKYEHALRVIGKHLDSEPSYNASVVEQPDGFTVRCYPARHQTDGRVTHFSWSVLSDLAVFNRAGRNVRRRPSRHRGIWQDFPSGHEDFFRAMGHVVDRSEGGHVSIDEIPGGLTVSFVRPAEDGAGLEKTHRVYRKEQIEDMIKSAQGRRRTRITVSA